MKDFKTAKPMVWLAALALFLSMLPIGTKAQTCTVSGVLTDYEMATPIYNANISYMLDDKKHIIVSDTLGHFSLTLPQGRSTKIRVSHVNYKETTTVIITDKKRQLTIKLSLKPKHSQLKEVAVTRTMPRAVLRGDTIVFKASNFKTHSDATSKELLTKIPGVSIRDKKVYFGDELIKQILIDGKEFFKGDVNLVLDNMQAYVIDEIEIFDKTSDVQEKIGVNDGNTDKAINLKTVKGTSRSQFGKATAGYGVDNVYKLYGMYNRFHDDIRLSVFGQWNNINEQNFSMIDLLSATGSASSSAPSQSPYSKGASESFNPTSSDDISSMLVDVSDYGVTKSQALGTNFSDDWCKGKMKFSGHYLYNESSNYTDYHIYDNYFGETASNNLQDMRVNNNNRNHRFNAKYEFDLTPSDYIMLRPAFAYQGKQEAQSLTDWTVATADTSLLLNQQTNTDQYVYSTSGEAMYLHKFKRKGQALIADARLSYIHTHEDIDMDFGNVQTDESPCKPPWQKTRNRLTHTCSPIYIHSESSTV